MDGWLKQANCVAVCYYGSEEQQKRSKESFYKYNVERELYYKLDLMDELINFKAKEMNQRG